MFKLQTDLILASKSPRRSELLNKLNINFILSPSSFVEQQTNNIYEQVCINASGKALNVAAKFKEGIVLAVDTAVGIEDKILGKPKDLIQAKDFIDILSGKEHVVVSGVAIYDIKKNKMLQDAAETKVEFYDLDEKEKNNYLEQINPLDKAGAYAIQEHGSVIVKRIVGDYYNVVGMPMGLIFYMLKKTSQIII